MFLSRVVAGGFCRLARYLLLLLTLLAAMPAARAQTVYATGRETTSANDTRLLEVNIATGAAILSCEYAPYPAPLGTFPIDSAAIAMNPADGLVYYIQYGVSPPRIGTIEPQTCAASVPVTSNLQSSAVVRATFCPDGRFYAGAADNRIVQINPVTSRVEKTVTITGVPVAAGGGGDIACTSNGDFYMAALTTASLTPPLSFSLYRISGASMHAAVNGASLAATRIGSLGIPGAVTGIAEVGQTAKGCNAAGPCLIVSAVEAASFMGFTIWGVDTVSGKATRIGSSGYQLSDLARGFPVDVQVAKSGPASALQGGKVRYNVTVGNAGPGPVSAVVVRDVFPPASFASVNWTCSVLGAGTDTQVTTACPASGSGDLNAAVSLSRAGTVQFQVDAVLAPGATGSVFNVAGVTLGKSVADSVPGNNSSTAVETRILPAANLTIAKTSKGSSVVAGQFTSYTVTVANLGPADAPGAVVRDMPAPGLECETVSCSATTGGSCPAASFAFADLLVGVAIQPSFSAGSTVNFVVSCGVRASGLPVQGN